MKKFLFVAFIAHVDNGKRNIRQIEVGVIIAENELSAKQCVIHEYNAFNAICKEIEYSGVYIELNIGEKESRENGRNDAE